MRKPVAAAQTGLEATNGRRREMIGPEQYRALFRAPKLSKYRNRQTMVDGIRFDSLKEAQRYCELRLLVRAGTITGLVLQPVYRIVVGRGQVLVGSYRGDFKYVNQNGREVVEDVKGVKTAVYKLKKRLVEALYGIQIQEV